MKRLILGFLIALLIIACGRNETVETIQTGSPLPDHPTTEKPIEGKFTKNVLVENFTGVWCGECPMLYFVTEQVITQGIHAVPVFIHRSQDTSNIDPFDFSEAKTLEEYLGVKNYPTGILNREMLWKSPNGNMIEQVKNLTGPNADLGILMNSEVVDKNIQLGVKVKFAAEFTGLKLVVYLLENELKSDQTNTTIFFDGANPLIDYNHNYVLKASLTDIIGKDIKKHFKPGEVYTEDFFLPVPVNISNTSKLSIVAFVTDDKGSVINVRKAEANEIQTFQENP